MKWNGFDTHFSTYSRFKACVLLVKKVGVEAGDWNTTQKSYHINDKRYTKLSWNKFSFSLKEHLVLFEFGEYVSSTELVSEFQVDNEKRENM